jgi:ABC-2 type transport system permease protein
MKIIRIALKDLTRSFRSAFLLAFMFAIPLLMTGMFYLMFGNQPTGDTARPVAAPRIVLALANLDTGSQSLTEGLATLSKIGAGDLPLSGSLGGLLASTLQSPSLAEMIEIQPAKSAAAARQAVDSRQAGAALIIPADFSTAYTDPQKQAVLELYQDPQQAAGGLVVRSILGQFTDMLSGTKIALGVIMAHAAPSPNGNYDLASLGPVIQQYTAWTQTSAQDPASLAELRSPAPDAAGAAASPLTQVVGPIMAGMLIFFAFFTGGATAQSILTEAEEGTLGRLFTTPTPLASILGGKFLSVGLTVLVQVTVQLAAGALIFGIRWGSLGVTLLAALGIVACATAFGIFITSLLKSTRQGGIVYGGLMTVTGMLGMMSIFSPTGLGQAISLCVPQGWAIRGLSLGMQGAAGAEPALNLLVVLAWSALFFGVGLWRFRTRFA